MSIKTLFDKQKQGVQLTKTVSQNTIQDFSSEVESSDYITQYQDSVNLYLQDVDFATGSNFAKFGSARKYYENITNRITKYYPYDGSKASQLEFENNLNPFEKYIHLYEYPRTTGYVTFDTSSTPQYIQFLNISDGNTYSPENGLKENIRFDFASGSTIEFWMKRSNQTVNNEIVCSFSGSNKELYISIIPGEPDKFVVKYNINGISSIDSLLTTGLDTFFDSTWHHYAMAFSTNSVGYKIDLYRDGVYNTTDITSGIVENFTGSMVGTISHAQLKLTASIDEFRFWNVKRDAKQIGLNYFTNVGGGNNKVPNSNIGIYFKFNEGITGDSTRDSLILDYAGRSCNGTFVGYSAGLRNTGSAITLTQDKPEAGTPIVYDTHPDVISFLSDKLILADEYDFTNNFALKNSMPAWILDEDAQNGDALTNFLQIMASYLDTLFLQITTFKDVKNKDYLNYKGKAPPFSDLLLTSNGFDLPALFLNTDIVQSLMQQDNKRTYDEKIVDLKNIIYKNIYNNLDIIYKSKGTESSIKQLIKTFGVDEDVYNLNIYANNTQYKLENSYTNKSIKKDYIDFTPFINSANTSAVIFQSGSNSFITGTDNNAMALTMECDFITPEFPPTYDSLAYQTLTFNTASIFGIGTATNTENQITISGSDPAGLKARYIYRDDKGYFSLYCTQTSTTLTSSLFSDITTNQHWNLSAKVVPVDTGSSYNLIFSGYTNFVGDQFREFSVSSSITALQGSTILSNNKRLYVGAERTNITGAVIHPTMMKALSVKYWADELTSDELKEHARNPNNYGRINPTNPYTLATGSYIPKSETLLLHWDFTNITSSDSSGNISVVQDLTSGSTSGNSYSNTPLNNLVGKLYNGAGFGFAQSAIVKFRDLVYSSEQQLPENLYSSQLIEILSTDDDYYTTAIRPQKYFFSLENSMYDVISMNMLNLFSSIIEFNNIIGEPMNNYKTQYSKLRNFRKIFFDKVQNQPDLDKYVGVYKWIDDALDSILVNLLPASANASEKVRTIVENHILERSKIYTPLIPDKSTLVTGGDSKILFSISKAPEVACEVIKVYYYNYTGYIPPVGTSAVKYMEPSNIANKQVSTIASRIKRK